MPKKSLTKENEVEEENERKSSTADSDIADVFEEDVLSNSSEQPSVSATSRTGSKQKRGSVSRPDSGRANNNPEEEKIRFYLNSNPVFLNTYIEQNVDRSTLQKWLHNVSSGDEEEEEGEGDENEEEEECEYGEGNPEYKPWDCNDAYGGGGGGHEKYEDDQTGGDCCWDGHRIMTGADMQSFLELYGVDLRQIPWHCYLNPDGSIRRNIPATPNLSSRQLDCFGQYCNVDMRVFLCNMFKNMKR